MEADWEVEIGDGTPVIHACWEGLVDLRGAPELAFQFSESRRLPALANALMQLNAGTSPFWTSKCDVWTPPEFDPDEMEARGQEGKCPLSCYIDLLPRPDRLWPSHADAVEECRSFCSRLRSVSLRCCRADLVIRRALITADRHDLGVTAYLTACGPTADAARAKLESVLDLFVKSVLAADHPATASAKLQ